ncbi:hypothetical protein [Brucella endophytica]|uniref:hypothetical protein n=1 Tax=Brucella endophytica TaxID=1963359 RepID=UPI0016640802|nr:hypothetical protein [Brucella endophytica]
MARAKQPAPSAARQLAPAGAVAPTPPPLLKSPRGGKADNLTLIDGVGDKLEKDLNSLGIFHFNQVSAWTPAEIAWVNRKIGFPGRVERENWVGKAALLASGVRTNFTKRVEAGQVKSSHRTRGGAGAAKTSAQALSSSGPSTSASPSSSPRTVSPSSVTRAVSSNVTRAASSAVQAASATAASAEKSMASAAKTVASAAKSATATPASAIKAGAAKASTTATKLVTGTSAPSANTASPAVKAAASTVTSAVVKAETAVKKVETAVKSATRSTARKPTGKK